MSDRNDNFGCLWLVFWGSVIGVFGHMQDRNWLNVSIFMIPITIILFRLGRRHKREYFPRRTE